MAKIAFERELENFQTQEETAQQFFFAYLAVHDLAAADQRVLAKINETSLFWLTYERAMLEATFIALGRIFDQDPRTKHNLKTLMAAASKDIKHFSTSALEARKRTDGSTRAQAHRFAQAAYALKFSDLREIGKEIRSWRKIYDAKYKVVRNKVFAHNEMPDLDETNKLLRRANIDEMKLLFAFLSDLNSNLWQAFHNGRKPLVSMRGRRLEGVLRQGEKVRSQGEAVLRSMLHTQSATQACD